MTIKIKIHGRLGKSGNEYSYQYTYLSETAKQKKYHWYHLSDGYSENEKEPRKMETPPFNGGVTVWFYKGYFLELFPCNNSDEEIVLHLKAKVLRHDKSLQSLRAEVESLERVIDVVKARREKISDAVRSFVWQRDRGRCVVCESNENLEFDHIIPFSRGGSSTERNIQLLCEQCNRSKGARI